MATTTTCQEGAQGLLLFKPESKANLFWFILAFLWSVPKKQAPLVIYPSRLSGSPLSFCPLSQPPCVPRPSSPLCPMASGALVFGKQPATSSTSCSKAYPLFPSSLPSSGGRSFSHAPRLRGLRPHHAPRPLLHSAALTCVLHGCAASSSSSSQPSALTHQARLPGFLFLSPSWVVPPCTWWLIQHPRSLGPVFPLHFKHSLCGYRLIRNCTASWLPNIQPYEDVLLLSLLTQLVTPSTSLLNLSESSSIAHWSFYFLPSRACFL